MRKLQSPIAFLLVVFLTMLGWQCIPKPWDTTRLPSTAKPADTSPTEYEAWRKAQRHWDHAYGIRLVIDQLKGGIEIIDHHSYDEQPVRLSGYKLAPEGKRVIGFVDIAEKARPHTDPTNWRSYLVVFTEKEWATKMKGRLEQVRQAQETAKQLAGTWEVKKAVFNIDGTRSSFDGQRAGVKHHFNFNDHADAGEIEAYSRYTLEFSPNPQTHQRHWTRPEAWLQIK